MPAISPFLHLLYFITYGRSSPGNGFVTPTVSRMGLKAGRKDQPWKHGKFNVFSFFLNPLIFWILIYDHWLKNKPPKSDMTEVFKKWKMKFTIFWLVLDKSSSHFYLWKVMKRSKELLPHYLFQLVISNITTRRKWLVYNLKEFFLHLKVSMRQNTVSQNNRVHQRAAFLNPFSFLNKEIFMTGLRREPNWVAMNYLKTPKYLLLLL